MRNKLYGLLVLWMLVCSVTTAEARVSIGIGLPNVSIGINLPFFPELVPVSGYPVYYAPEVEGNYFFYDGMYWVYQDDNWYASTWYNGPWEFVEPEVVPLFVLRIPVRYYRQPPVYFRGWEHNAPPRWGKHWGHEWEHQRRGWDRWKRSSVPARAPRPVYQREYSGDRYPRVEQQHTVRNESYRYQPREKVVRKHFQQVKQEVPQTKSLRPPEPQRSTPVQQSAPATMPRTQPQSRVEERFQRSAPDRTLPQQQQGTEPQEQRRKQPRVQELEQKSPGRTESQEPGRGHGQGRDRDDDGRGRDRDEGRGRGRNN